MNKSIAIFWFRRDLRLEDNCGLFHALQSGYKVLPIFIFDEDILEDLPKDDARVAFIYKQLQKINETLQKKGSNLTVFKGKPLAVFEQILREHEISAIYTNRDYEPYALRRDAKVALLLEAKNVAFYTHKDQVIFERNEIVKDDGTPYKVYTPFSKKWLATFKNQPEVFYPSEKLQNQFVQNKITDFPSLATIGFKEPTVAVAPFVFTTELIDSYEETRNFPAKESTSKLGTHLRFGTVSIRKIVHTAQQQSNNTFLKELIWREFFMQVLWHFPQTLTKSFKPKYDRIPWRNNESEFEHWKNGTTGYPLVDAGMRQLNATGFMHNRVRMLVGSFLCKHLLIDWRWGEAYFAEKLHDYEMSSNIGNWQWVAGCGVDAAPYFRIFNPTSQILKFDKQLAYINQWVPEHQELTYPTPIVDHKMARERCLRVYKEAITLDF